MPPLERKLLALDNKLEGHNTRALAAIQQLAAEVEKNRALTGELLQRTQADLDQLKRAASNTFLSTSLFLLYLFGVCTWMMLMLTDLT
jgi:hypothetical protein